MKSTCRTSLPVVLASALLAAPAAGDAGGALLAAEKPGDIAGRVIDKVRAGPAALDSALDAYCRLEGSKRLDVFARHKVHEEILGALRGIRDEKLAEGVDALLKSTAKSEFPAQVLALKAIIGSDFPAPREKRVDWLARAATGKSRGLSIWGVRLLGESRWPEAIDQLIEILRGEEMANPNGLLASMVSAELYRVLGSKGRGTSGEVQKGWEAAKKKVLKDPDYSSADAGEVTVAFFGDRVSPFSAFAIDMSSSMLEKASLRSEVSRGSTAVKGKEKSGPQSPKVDIVKAELQRTLDGLQSHCKFNILGYNSTVTPWRIVGTKVGLHSAGQSTVKSAKDFVAGLAVAVGTNIHDALATALDIPDVETVYLLSDGVPSRGGGPAEVERRAAAMNYLTGARIVTYGFTAEGPGSFDEAFMKRLAEKSWGWYRRLN